MAIRIGIMGYGNLGRGVECAIRQNPDTELAAVFTRRQPGELHIRTEGVPVYAAADAAAHAKEIDVLILCGGSATDLPAQTPEFAKFFHVVDSFDTHARIPEHFAAVNAAAKEAGKVAVISCGWDPGMFSLNRVYADAILPGGTSYTFWGRGVSQGHSDAVRRIDGVLDARQYTIPVEEAMERIRRGETPELTTRQKHTREVFVVAADGADKERITREIVTMPNYFDAYDTAVHFITAEEMKRDHAALPHGGLVIRSGKTGWDGEDTQIIEYKLRLDSNPGFTSSVLLCCARAAWRMGQEGQSGCRTVLDIAPSYFSAKSAEELRSQLL
ncbi:diaminopimelate dehydrogenase [Lachnoclostridium sp. Marseille-P6806]|uniref:diaminopimelate dehydrogenase n=1 Tax=Lachnoclostridium sp. Marseille-P6806 TaxID=2364793 RepID=UPI00103042E0|nr:diaminopimelate dehydrogenase [Lachnoclostridium sp. Marseille-P6806]